MCVIIDTSVVGLLFRNPKDRMEAATKFLDYINKRKVELVVGGKLTFELCKGSNKFELWLSEAIRNGKAKKISKSTVCKEENRLKLEGNHKSNDLHVLALALVSGARLLYTHDQLLIDDFKNNNIITGNRGKIYKTDQSTGSFSKSQRRLLDNAYCEI